jgi:hypothetical protein
MTKSAQVYQLKITLRDIKPPIWRRVQVKDCTLGQLHDVIQVCMDWTNSHLHDFVVAGQRFGAPSPDVTLKFDGDEAGIKLSDLLKRKIEEFHYKYDFGDDWDHIIQVEEILPAEPGIQYPRCLTGKRSGPPEDCGGAWGYANLLQILSDPKHAKHQEMNDWVPEAFDPEGFDLELINDELKALS